MDIDWPEPTVLPEHTDNESTQLDLEDAPEEKLLVVSLLNPTRMGAQYAMRRSHDYEYDLDRYPKSQTPTASYDLDRNSYFENAGHNTTFSNSASVFQQPWQLYQRPLQVHHYHHVVTPVTPAHPPNSGAPLAISETRPSLGISEPQRDIPLPWESKSTPAERTAYILLTYLQFVFNGVLSCYALHLVWVIVRAIRQDVSNKLRSHANSMLVEVALCERSYYENNCLPDQIVPALEKMCAYWEKCMKQDVDNGGNASSVGAYTIGLIVTSLVEPLSFKVLAVLTLAVVVVYLCNFAFGYVRARTYYGEEKPRT